MLTRVQHQLFDLGGELCIPGHAAIYDADIDALEARLDHYNDPLPALKDFILPGGGEAAARCHVARTVVRRAERETVALARHEPVRPQAIRYLNGYRSSVRAGTRDGRASGHGEVLWDPNRRNSEGTVLMHVYTHTACLLHDTGPGHAERPERLRVVIDALHAAYPALDWHEAPRASRGQLLRAHAPALLGAVLDNLVLKQRPQERIQLDPDTVLSPHSAEAGLRAAGAGVAAVDAVLGGQATRAFCAVRPPGHHATHDSAMGFCLFNSIAVAALHALDRHGWSAWPSLFRVHHGNGSQAIFEHDHRVCLPVRTSGRCTGHRRARRGRRRQHPSTRRCRPSGQRAVSVRPGPSACCPQWRIQAAMR